MSPIVQDSRLDPKFAIPIKSEGYAREAGRRDLTLLPPAPSPWLGRAKALDKALHLLGATSRAHGGVGLHPHRFHRGRAVGDGIDYVHLRNVVTGAKILIQVFSKSGRELAQWIAAGICFQNRTTPSLFVLIIGL